MGKMIVFLLAVSLSFFFCGDEIRGENPPDRQNQHFFDQARQLYLQGDLASARAELLKYVSLSPKDTVAVEFLETVEDDIRELEEKKSSFAEHLNRGRGHYQQSNWEQAKEELRLAVASYPQHPTVPSVVSLWEKINGLIIAAEREKAEEDTIRQKKELARQEKELGELERKLPRAHEKDRKPSTPLVEEKFDKPLLNLKSCIHLAVLNNLALRVAKDQVELAEMRLFEAWRNLFPSVTGEIRDTYGKTTEGAYEARSRALKFQQLVFDGGRGVFLLHQAELGQKIAQENYNKVKGEVVFETEAAYHRLVYYEKMIRSQKELYRIAGEDLKMAEEQFQGGYISQLEFLNIESVYNDIGLGLHSAQQGMSLAKLKFQQVLNIQEQFSLSVDTSGNRPLRDLPLTLDRALNLSLNNHPEMYIAQLKLAVSKYGEKIAQRTGWPELNLFGTVGQSGEAYTTDVLHMRDEWAVLGKLSWTFGGSSMDYSYTKESVTPQRISQTSLTTEGRTHEARFGLLDNLGIYSKEKEAQIAFHQALSDYNDLRQKTIMSLKEAYYLYERAKIVLESFENKLKFYAKELEIAELKNSLDMVPLSAVLEARVKLADKQNERHRAVMEYDISIAALNKAIGINFYLSDKGD